MNTKQSPPMLREPTLGPNFAAGVLKKADMLVARRRRIRAEVAGLSTACVTAAAVVIGVRALTPANTHTALRPPHAVVALNDPTVGEQAEALAYMFPDAAALARLDDRYFAAASTNDDPLSTDTGGSEADE